VLDRGGSRILEWGHWSRAEGASIEAPQAPRVEAPQQALRGLGFEEGMCRCPSPENFLFFLLKIVHFGVYSDKNSQFIRPIAGLKTACK